MGGLLFWMKWMVNHSALGGDFSQDYFAALAALKGISLYTIDLSSLGLQGPEWINFRNFHPPTSALLFLPLAPFSLKTGFIVVSVLSLVLYVWLVRISIRPLGLPDRVLYVLPPILLLWYPFVVHSALGQSSLFIAAGITAAYVLLQKRYDLLAGGVIALVGCLKLYPFLFLLLFFALRRWVAAAGSVLVGSILLGLTLLFVDSREFLYYFTVVAAENFAAYRAFPVNSSLAGFYSTILTQNSWAEVVGHFPLICNSLIAISVFLVTALTFASLRQRKDESLSLAFGGTAAAMLLVAPLTWQHLFPVLLPFQALLYRRLAPAGKKLLLLSFLFLSIPDVTLSRSLLELHAPHKIPWEYNLLLRLPTVGIFLSWVLFVSVQRKGGGEQPAMRVHFSEA
jgi:hypothetical protein